MSGPDMLAAALASVVPVRNGQGIVIGTGVVVAADTVLTALHVTTDLPSSSLYIADDAPVTSVHSLPIRRFGRSRRQARTSRERVDVLAGVHSSTVDLALLTVRDFTVSTAVVRRQPVRKGERVAIAGYPNGEWTVSVGPVTSTDDADYVAHVLLGPGSSGAPALDVHGQVCGLVTLDHLSAGAILIGPQLLDAFLHRSRRHPWRRPWRATPLTGDR